MFFPRTASRPFLALSLAGLSVLACAKQSSSNEELDPPILEIVGFQNTDGVVFAENEEVSLPCDSRLTVLLGPSEDAAGFLDDWILRPPGVCGTPKQCGFVRLELFDEAGDSKVIERASLAIIVDPADLPGVVRIKATLIAGSDLQEFLVEDQPVTDEWPLNISESCDDGMGGAGGTAMGGGSSLGGSSN